MKIILTVMKGDLAGKKYTFEKKAVIGRSPKAQIVLDDDLISRKHAEISIKDDAVFIKDLKSAGGTFVNSQPVADKTMLKSRDKIRVADIIFEIKILKPKKKTKKDAETSVAAQKLGRTLSDIARTDTEQIDTAKVTESLKEDQSPKSLQSSNKAEKPDVYASKRSQNAQQQAIEVVTKYKGIKQTKKKVSLKNRLGFLSMYYDEMTWWMKLAFASGIVVVALLLGQLGFSLFDSEPSEAPDNEKMPIFIPDTHQKIAWPSGSGYENLPKNCPFNPHKVAITYTECFITDFTNGEITAIGDIETNGEEQLIVHPGAVITNAYQGSDNIKLTDYNGDICILPYGAKIEVTEYGVFKLLDDDSDMVQEKLEEMKKKLAEYEKSGTPNDENKE